MRRRSRGERSELPLSERAGAVVRRDGGVVDRLDFGRGHGLAVDELGGPIRHCVADTVGWRVPLATSRGRPDRISLLGCERARSAIPVLCWAGWGLRSPNSPAASIAAWRVGCSACWGH